MSESKRKKFVYKVAKFLKETGDATLTLEKLLKAAVKKVPKALDRSQNPDGSDFRFLNYSGSHIIAESASGLYGCEFLGYDKGADQSTIKIDPNVTEVNLDHIVTNENEEFLAGSVYFGVAGNHVILVLSSAIRSKDVENYINWFLIEKAKVLGEDNRVGLADHTPKKGKSMKGVKGIEIGGPILLKPTSPHTPAGQAPPVGKEASFPVALGGKAWEVVKTIFSDGFNLPSELNLKNLTDAPDLEVRVFLKWKGAHGEEDVDFLNSIAKNMSHVDDELDYTIHTKTGTITKDDFKLQQHFSFKWNKGRPVFDDIFPKMAEWLALLVNTGKIEA